MGHASKERVVLIGTDQRITSGPAATTAAFKGRIHGCTRTFREKVRFFSLHHGRRPYITDLGSGVCIASVDDVDLRGEEHARECRFGKTVASTGTGRPVTDEIR
jgi:hypothetical protein